MIPSGIGRRYQGSSCRSERTDPHLHELPWYRRPIPLGIIAGLMVITLNSIFH